MSSHPAEGPPIPKTLADAWKQRAADEGAVTRAYARFLGRRTPPKPALSSALGWLVAGMLIGVGTLHAANRVASWQSRSTSSPPTEGGRRVTPPAPRVGAPPSSSLEAPSGVLPADSAASPSARPRSVPKAPAAESWQRVARGMRESDLETADDALLKLSHQGSQAEREVAKLVRAQVLMRQGKTPEARILLDELGKGAASTATRDKAARLLDQLEAALPSQRSFELEPPTKAPR
jgi:hypothetical protein